MYEIYPVNQDYDKSTTVICYFDTLTSAEAFVKGNPYLRVAKPMQVYSSTDDYAMNNPEARRKRVLNKLTLEEQRILGLV